MSQRMMGSLIREYEIESIPFLIRSEHPTKKYPFLYMREDGVRIIEYTPNEKWINHVGNVKFYLNNESGSSEIQIEGIVSRAPPYNNNKRDDRCSIRISKKHETLFKG